MELENNEIPLPLSLKKSNLSLVMQTKPNEDGYQPQTRYQSAHESPILKENKIAKLFSYIHGLKLNVACHHLNNTFLNLIIACILHRIDILSDIVVDCVNFTYRFNLFEFQNCGSKLEFLNF